MSTSDRFIPYGRQSISREDIDAVVNVLQSDWLTQGPAIEAFEGALCRVTGAAHAVSMSNATAALHIACLALDAGPGDSVWTSPNSFVASANCAIYCGAKVDFVDIDPATLNMSIDALAAKLEAARRDGKLPKVVIPVHFAGQSCDMAAIHRLSKDYGFRVIEDASHAIGGSFDDKPIGSCAFSDITVFSFHPVKIVTTAEGGVALTNDAGIAERLALLRSHGVTRDPGLMERAPDGPWFYDQVALGYNYRMTDIQAALGTSQLARLNQFVERRHSIADRYDSGLAGLPLILPRRSIGRSALHLYPVQVQDASRRRAAFDALRAAGIGVNVHYIPIHTQPYYQRLGFRPGDFPNAENYYAGAISLPMFPAIGDADVDRVMAKLTAALA